MIQSETRVSVAIMVMGLKEIPAQIKQIEKTIQIIKEAKEEDLAVAKILLGMEKTTREELIQIFQESLEAQKQAIEIGKIVVEQATNLGLTHVRTKSQITLE